LLTGIAGILILEHTLPNPQAGEILLWTGRLLSVFVILGAFFLVLASGLRFRSGNANRADLETMSTFLAEQDTRSLSTSMAAITQGDFTQPMKITTQPLKEDGRGDLFIAKTLNRILENLKECTRSYNWITDEALQRLFFIGTDSFQLGQIVGDVIGKRSGGGGQGTDPC
jgi:hypothetical protein